MKRKMGAQGVVIGSCLFALGIIAGLVALVPRGSR